jgi:hypothetical protein
MAWTPVETRETSNHLTICLTLAFLFPWTARRPRFQIAAFRLAHSLDELIAAQEPSARRRLPDAILPRRLRYSQF